MLNRKPIFIVGFSRGGSSVILNILRSHPDVCSPRGETDEVFLGKGNEPISTRLSKRLGYTAILLLQREHVFSMRTLETRRPLSARSAQLIDQILYREKLLATGDTQNRFRSEGVEYTEDEIRAARLLLKNLDALAFTTPLFASMYPDATFFGLIRNGLAICESHVRRGESAAAYGRLYSKVCRQILADAERVSNFHLVRYEVLTNDVLAGTLDIYKRAHLDVTCVKKFRLVVGTEGHTGGDAEHLRWYTPQEFSEVIRPSFDAKQIAKLSHRDRDDFLCEAGEIMEKLGYI
jgi:Sulfotransferase family